MVFKIPSLRKRFLDWHASQGPPAYLPWNSMYFSEDSEMCFTACTVCAQHQLNTWSPTITINAAQESIQNVPNNPLQVYIARGNW